MTERDNHTTILAHKLSAEKNGRVKARSVATATLGLGKKKNISQR